MAIGRFINKKISLSEQVSNLPVEGQLLFTWLIPHADDLGLLPGSSKTIKAMVCPLLDIDLTDIDRLMTDIVSQGLALVCHCEGTKLYYLPKFDSQQSLRKDRQPQTILPHKASKDPKETWSMCEKTLTDIVRQTTGNAGQMTAEMKGNEMKRKETDAGIDSQPTDNAKPPTADLSSPNGSDRKASPSWERVEEFASSHLRGGVPND